MRDLAVGSLTVLLSVACSGPVDVCKNVSPDDPNVSIHVMGAFHGVTVALEGDCDSLSCGNPPTCADPDAKNFAEYGQYNWTAKLTKGPESACYVTFTYRFAADGNPNRISSDRYRERVTIGTSWCGGPDGAADFTVRDQNSAPDAAGPPVCATAPPTRADIDYPDGAPGWNAPRPPQASACSPADLQRFGDKVNDPNLASWSDAVDGLPATCAQCLVSRGSDATWQLVVTDATGKYGFLNWGACYADAPHGSTACGQAVQYRDFCIGISCEDCASGTEIDACKANEAVAHACDGAFAAMLQASCPQQYAEDLDHECGHVVDAASILCGDGTLSDGGVTD